MMDDLDKAAYAYARRRRIFVEEGLCDEQASDLADAMFERDQDIGDERRVCFECQHYENKRCNSILDKLGRPTMPLRFILQRCDHFQLRGKK
jgi:hypothetical protein